MRRIILATIISFIFFIAYDYLVLQPQMVVTEQNSTVPAKGIKRLENKGEDLSHISQKTVPTSIVKKDEKKEIGKVVGVVEGKGFQLKIDQFGRITSFKLTQHRFQEEGKELELVSPTLPKPLEIRFKEKELNRELYSSPVTLSTSHLVVKEKEKELVITHTLPSFTLIKRLKFYPDGHYTLKVEISKPVSYFISPGYRPSAVVDNLTIHGVEVQLKDGKLRIFEDGDGEKGNFQKVTAVASFDRYYISFFYFPKLEGKVIVTTDKKGNPIPFVEGEGNLQLVGYIGPKYVDRLKSINPKLVNLVQYGLGTFFARNLFLLLDWFYKIGKEWGLAIILLVIFVRLVLFPLTWKGMVSMHKLKELAPKIKELQERYKKDPATLQKKMMELYRKHNANPLGGCLPLLLQIPIFYGIYKLLLYSIELKGASFFWIGDLAKMDPFFILPALMGVTMYLHQKITPTNFQDPMQEKVFKFLPILADRISSSALEPAERSSCPRCPRSRCESLRVASRWALPWKWDCGPLRWR